MITMLGPASLGMQHRLDHIRRHAPELKAVVSERNDPLYPWIHRTAQIKIFQPDSRTCTV